MRIRKQWHLMSCPPPPPDPSHQELHHHDNPFLEQPKHHSKHLPQLQSDLQTKGGWSSSTYDGDQEAKNNESREKVKRGELIMHHFHTTYKEEPLNPADQGESIPMDDHRLAVKTILRNTSAKPGTSISASSASSSSSHQGGVDIWCKEEMTFPVKKRRESFKLIELDERKSSTTGVTRKVIKKKPIVVEEYESKSTKKARRGSCNDGAMLMEGSRCSRVNGRGWRCCQPTLVGYALCEHHLGKARFRSISNNAPKKKKMINTFNDPPPMSISTTTTLSSSEEMKELEEEVDEVMVTILKKRKIGMVKARSLSSLLGLSTHHQHRCTKQYHHMK